MNLKRLTAIAAPVIAATQRKLPAPVRTPAGGVPVHFEALPAQDVIDDGFEPDILGLFTGSPYGAADDQPLPAQIILYLENLWDFAEGDEEIFREEVRLTYLHELGHFLGWDEDDLTARGLD